MDNNDSIKPQQTGGLKIMTVFIVVLALHVVVIGGFTVYHLMSGGVADADLTTTDKTHKSLKNADGSAIADGASPDVSPVDKSITTPAPATEAATAPANPPTPAPDSVAPTVTSTPTPTLVPVPAPTPAPAPTIITPTLTPLAPPMELANQGSLTPTDPISSELAPPAEPVPVSAAPVIAPPAPVAPVASGPVHMPPAVASAPVHEHEQIYVVKITDSYKKIAHAHHVTVAELKEANHIKGDVLHTGQKLIIPSGKTLVATTSPATTLDAAPTSPVLNESAAPITTGLATTPTTVAPTTSHSHLYTVVKGDTLIKIAHKFKTTATAIMTENSITDPAKLTIGKKLKIPSQESRSAKNSVPASTQPSQVQTQENPASGQLANFVP